MSMSELALIANNNGDATDFTYGTDPNNFLTWDYDRIHGCVCDDGFDGYDCSLKKCPIGDDPGTYYDHSEVQLLSCVANAGNFTLSFRQAVTPPLSFNITAIQLQDALAKLNTIKNIRVYFTSDILSATVLPPNNTVGYFVPKKFQPAEPINGKFFNGTTVFEIIATKPNATVNSTLCHTYGFQTAIIVFEYTHGNLPAIIANNSNLSDYDHDTGAPGTGSLSVFQDGESFQGVKSVKGTTETDVCNNRGLCDTSTGVCSCFADWMSSDGARQGGPGSTGDCGYRDVERII
jgi:hypothetical protein